MQDGSFAAFVDAYFSALFEWSPAEATAAGIHDHDSRIEDFSARAFESRIAALKGLRARLTAFRELPPDDAIDAEILQARIDGELLDLETLQVWRRNPLIYVGLPGSAVDGLIKRNFAPPGVRLRAVIARLSGIPPLMDALRANLDDPPRELAALAARIAQGSAGFFESTVAQWAAAAAGGDTAALEEFEERNKRAAAVLNAAATWLDESVVPKASGGFAIGAGNFSRKLRYDEMVDMPLDRLLALGEATLARDFQAFVETAAKLDPGKTPAEVMKSISDRHPTEDSLIPDARKTVEDIVRFIRERGIVTIPSDVPPSIVEAPPYLRSYGFAFMDTPGAYETAATEAFYYVSPAEPDWPPEQKEEHLRLFNAPVMEIITIHEAYPGHYIQFLYAKEFPTRTRKLISVGSNSEGWAHYTEQMMVEEGYGGGDPRIRLAQLNEALLRDARFVVGIKLHTEGWTIEQGAKFFEDKAFQEPANAYSEARRGAYNPTYLYYTLGKLQIYELREEYRKAKGAEYSLRGFHDEFVKQGSIPISIIRRLMLPKAAR